MGAGELTVVVLNLEDGGFDREHGDHRGLDLLPELLAQVGAVDVLLFQEGKRFCERGQALRFRAEAVLEPFGLRSFMTRSRIGQLHDLVFVAWPRLRPVEHFTPDLPDVFHDQVGWVCFRIDGVDGGVSRLWVRSVQWPSWDGGARLEAAQKLTRFAAPGLLSLVGGDFNALWPDCDDHLPEFEPDWVVMPAHKRLHKTLPPGLRPGGRLVSDRRAGQLLAEAGFVNVGCMAGDVTPTVNTRVDAGQGGRIDHLLLSPALSVALVPGSYRVWVSGLGDRVSDHRMLSARLNLNLLTVSAGGVL